MIKDPFEKIRDTMWLYDETFFDFLPGRESPEIQKVVERYIKKSKPKVFIVSTKSKDNKNVK